MPHSRISFGFTYIRNVWGIHMRYWYSREQLCKNISGINISTSKECTVIKTVKNTVIKTVPVTSAQQSVTLQLWLKHPALRYTDTHSCLFMQTHSHSHRHAHRHTLLWKHGVRDSLFLMLWAMKTWVQVARITPGTVRGRRVRGESLWLVI